MTGEQVLVVGAGMYGATVARVLADAGRAVLVRDRRAHIGGNCFTRYDEPSQCHEHVYGAHIFHTNDERVWEFLNRFAEFRPYRHTVKVVSRGSVYPLPFNLLTWQMLHGPGTAQELRQLVAQDCQDKGDPETVAGWCYRNIGDLAYRRLVRDYTAKQWRRSAHDLPASIIRRLPIRWTYDDGYFQDRYQGIPRGGYTLMFERMLAGVPVEVGANFTAADGAPFAQVFYSGGLDELWNYELGELTYRRVRFQGRHLPAAETQGQAVLNHADYDVRYTRTLEHRYFDADNGAPDGATILRTEEYPEDWQRGMDGYYPLRDELNLETHGLYVALTTERYGDRLTVGGRQGRYQYFDMHQVCAMALRDAQTYLERTR